MKVLVVLPRELDVGKWRSAYAAGLVPDLTPYGYHHAKKFGCEVAYSAAMTCSRDNQPFWQRTMVRILGCDFPHAWHNRRRILDRSIDFVWTHTEREFLAVALLLKLYRRRRPRLLAQSVWMIDEWHGLSHWRQAFNRWLTRSACVATFHSPVNAAMARDLGLNERVEVVAFGISMDSFAVRPVALREPGEGPIRILALGNDMHRDWNTFRAAFAGDRRFDVRVASRNYPKAGAADNVRVQVLGQREVAEAYGWADVVVVPLLENMHASGCTTVLEAVAMGKPVVTHRVGGLDHYFGCDCLWYCPAGDSAALTETVLQCAREPETAKGRAIRARQRLIDEELTTEGFARRHVVLCRSLAA